MRKVILSLLLCFGATGATLNVGTGQTYTTIQAACTAATTGDTVFVHAAGSPYAGCQIIAPHVGGITVLAENSSVVVNSPGDVSGDIFNFDTVDSIILDGFEVTAGTRMGVRVISSTGSIVRNCNIHNNASNGILTGFLTNFQVYANSISVNGTSAGQHNVYISNSDTAYNGIHIYGNTIFNAVAGNNLQLNGDCSTLDNSGFSTGEITGFLIERNLFYGGPAHAIQLIDSSYGLIRNNVMYGAASTAIQTGSQAGCNGGSNYDVFMNNTIDAISGGRIVQPATGTIWYNNLVVSTDPRGCVNDITGQACTTGSKRHDLCLPRHHHHTQCCGAAAISQTMLDTITR